mmetsp:Transcript_18171/g.45831  ORF Transcript_18171/g.45831 Transcript_18171/m.45831 type:complete len:468 (+) Transcript_18171:138-1541(+)
MLQPRNPCLHSRSGAAGPEVGVELGGDVAEGHVGGGDAVLALHLGPLRLELGKGRTLEGAERHREELLLPLGAAQHLDLDLVVGLVLLHDLAQVRRRHHLVLVDAHNHVAQRAGLPLPLPHHAPHPRLGARRVGGDLEHHGAALHHGDPALGGLLRGGEPLQVRDAEHGPLHLPKLHELLHDALGRVDGDGEAHPRAHARPQGGGVDADEPAVAVEEGPPRVARVDRSVSLHDPVDLAARGRRDLPVLARDDAGGEGVVLAKGVSDGDGDLSDLDGCRRAELQGDKVLLGGVDLEHGNVLVGVYARELRVVYLLVAIGVREGDLGGVNLVDDVKVGDNVALLVPHEAAAHALWDLGGVHVEALGERRVVGGDEADGGHGVLENPRHQLLDGKEPGRGGLWGGTTGGERGEGEEGEGGEGVAARGGGGVVPGLHVEGEGRAAGGGSAEGGDVERCPGSGRHEGPGDEG